MIHWRENFETALSEAAAQSKFVLFDVFNPG